MANRKIFILSTRPVGAPAREAALAHDIVIDEIPFIQTNESIDVPTATAIQKLATTSVSVVFTSMNAVEAVGKRVGPSTPWTVYCIGNTTRRLVEKYFGSNRIAGTADNALQLADTILANQAARNIVFFCGDQRRPELPERLRDAGVEVEELEVYKTVETPLKIEKTYDALLFFSPSAVKSFFSANRPGPQTRIFVIGGTTARAAGSFTGNPILVADKPGKENLVKMAIAYYSKSPIS